MAMLTSSGPTTPANKPWMKIAGVVAGLTVAVSLMVLAFLAPAINAGPHNLPLAVSGSSAAVDQIGTQLATAKPDAFDITVFEDAAAVSGAVHNRDAVGGLTSNDDGTVTITTAGGAGTPYTALLQDLGTMLESTGQTVTYNDVAPLTADDPNGSGLGALGLPLAFGGMISAVLLSTLLKGRPVHRIAGSIIASLVVGFVVIAVLQFGFGSIDGNYVTTSLGLALGVAAISLFVLGMESMFGFAGLGIGGLLMMFVGNPLSGMATGWMWLPPPWGFIGQLMPIGAFGTLIRSTAFFDGHGASTPIIVLTCWAAAGIALSMGAAARARRAPTTTEPPPLLVG